MAKKSFVPRTDGHKRTWLGNLFLKLLLYLTKYNIAAADQTAMQDDSAYFNYWLDVIEIVDTFKQKVVAFKNELRDGVASGATASTPPSFPPLPAPPTVVTPGIFDRAIAVGKRIKSHKDYVVSDGEDMGLEGAEQDMPDLTNGKPVIKLVLKGGLVWLLWSKGLFDALYIEVDRGDGQGWRYLSTDTEPDYGDTVALPAAATLWKYRAIYVFHDAKVAQWSDEASISVKA